jgi:hypothetical protein
MWENAKPNAPTKMQVPMWWFFFLSNLVIFSPTKYGICNQFLFKNFLLCKISQVKKRPQRLWSKIQSKTMSVLNPTCIQTILVRVKKYTQIYMVFGIGLRLAVKKKLRWSMRLLEWKPWIFLKGSLQEML